MAMYPEQEGVFFQLIVQGGGEFVYDSSGNLRSSNVGQATTDPVQGIACPQGFATYNGFGAVVNLLSTTSAAAGFFQYFDNKSAVQGPMILAVTSANGNDPVGGTAYVAGLTGINQVLGDQMRVIGSKITLAGAFTTRFAQVSILQGAGATRPYLLVDSPERTTAGHMELLLQSISPDGTVTPQLTIGSSTGAVLASVSKALAEIQGPTAPVDPILQLIAVAAGDKSFGVRIPADTSNRFAVDSNGQMSWGPGNASQDVTLQRSALGVLQVVQALLVSGGLTVTGGETADTVAISSGQAAGQLLKVTNTTSAPSSANILVTANAAADNTLAIFVAGDTSARFRVDSNGQISWGPGNASQDISLQRGAANRLDVITADLRIGTAGRGFRVQEGTNAKQGLALLSAGTVVVSTTAVTANSRIFLTAQDLGTVTVPSALCVSARTAGTSFTIKASQATDTSHVAWEIFEPG